MSRGNILIVVNDKDKKAMKAALKGTKPSIDDSGPLCEFQLEGVEVDLVKNESLSKLQPALDALGEDDYALIITIERLEELHTYGSPKMFGLADVLDIPGLRITEH
jgi:hypothetical protein